MVLEIWFDSARDGIELQPERSFVGLSRHLAAVPRRPYTDAPANIQALFDYQAPDCVISYRSSPVLSLEITDMNPSGHNIPQRFLCMLRAAELSVPGIMFCMRRGRRRISDGRQRNINPRFLMTQARLEEIFDSPNITVFWPTTTQGLPQRNQSAQEELAQVVDDLIDQHIEGQNPNESVRVQHIQNSRQSVIQEIVNPVGGGGGKLRTRNPSVNRYFPNGIPGSVIGEYPIDPAREPRRRGYTHSGVTMYRTETLLNRMQWLWYEHQHDDWTSTREGLMERPYTLVYRARSNGSFRASEHPFPGMFAMYDILYSRLENGRLTNNRRFNMVYDLSMDWAGLTNDQIRIALRRLSLMIGGNKSHMVERLPVIDANAYLTLTNRDDPPRNVFPVDVLADLITLEGGVIAGQPLRGQENAQLVLYNATKSRRML